MQGYGVGFHAPKVDVHQFSMVPRADIPRSTFKMQSQHKTTINASYLYPVYLQEVLPGDSFNVSMSAFVRLATPLYPIMDNMELEVFFFFVPNRLTWVHWPNFMGEQNSPADSIVYSIPQVVSPAGGFPQFSLMDYFGIPCNGQTAGGNTITVSALPFRGYNFIVQEWFRDQNLVTARQTGSTGVLAAGAKWMCQSDDGPDTYTNYVPYPVAKRHDYFTSCLPWTQKQTASVTLPLGTVAPVIPTGPTAVPQFRELNQAGQTNNFQGTNASTAPKYATAFAAATNSPLVWNQAAGSTGLQADLSAATAATINAIRLAFQTQRLLERDARSGTRYTEVVRSHFGVNSPDARLMRPEFLSSSKFPITIAPVPQTTATGLTGGSSPIGTLAGAGLGRGSAGYRQSFVEHGYVFGLAVVRNDKIYQQGLDRHWSRLTRYDFFWPVFSMLGEQAVLNKEIYSDGSANDALTFGYQERWAEYRWHRSLTSGYFRSTNTTPLDSWHLAQKFTALPALNTTFITDDLATTLQRNLAAGAASDKQQFLCDFFFNETCARPMPMYSVPGMIDHF